MTNTRRIRSDYYDPFLIGFDALFNKAAKANDGYPPYNILKASDTAYLLELAVAGFGEDDFDITLKDNVLTIKGDLGTTEMPNDYIHKGIATRPFVRTFTLADGIKVADVSLRQGMLTIRLEKTTPPEDEPIKFKVNTGA